MLRIGLDATAIPPKRVGAGNYIFNLVDRLAKLDTENEYFIFAKQEHVHEWNIRGSNFHFVVSASRVRTMRIAWEQCILPLLIRRYALDVLHSPHYTIPVLNGSKSVVTFCDMIFYMYPQVHTFTKRLFFRWFIHRSARRADCIIAISESTAKDIARILQIPRERIVSVPLGVGEAYRPVRNERQLSEVCGHYRLEPHKYILYVGVLEPRKNIPRLLDAYASLREIGLRQPLAIVGRRGWRCEDLFRAIAALGLEEQVVFTGYVPEQHLPVLYSAARAFVYPSLYEGFGLPVLEAMACGTPVVTSCASSMPEVVGDAGVLINPERHEDIAAGIRRVLEDPDLECWLREAGPARAALFTWERTASQTIEVYKQACGRN
jgi:glycosyltransferase involved in cell wall biosynthesis